ncbi:hypothetical protein DPMN_088042 [Dreissena polymorpha]|uniref:Uncharacterized protein n=1 Tax=Dreissena polymorpha TaxID=45954 RepID=A0A9D4C4E5_DREPO|nr:hypothetical protein DPMN_059579 [Dreissena polymorpha]KAH3845754.1 hypothetical protein DPMN_088042 [Dreissena polymorpha]
MAPDTKVPDGRTDNAKTISLRLWRGIINRPLMPLLLEEVIHNAVCGVFHQGTSFAVCGVFHQGTMLCVECFTRSHRSHIGIE